MMFSCHNKDIEMIVEQNDCGCIQEVFTRFDTTWTTYCYDHFQDCNKLRKDSNVMMALRGTNPVFIRNISKTKVYDILIQKEVNGVVSYKSYKIEPTGMWYVGCNRDFKVQINSFEYNRSGVAMNNSCEDRVKVLEMVSNEVTYQIHKIDLLSEY